MKEFCKLVYICRSYDEQSSVLGFLTHIVGIFLMLLYSFVLLISLMYCFRFADNALLDSSLHIRTSSSATPLRNFVTASTVACTGATLP